MLRISVFLQTGLEPANHYFPLVTFTLPYARTLLLSEGVNWFKSRVEYRFVHIELNALRQIIHRLADELRTCTRSATVSTRVHWWMPCVNIYMF